jgi:predicted permease
MVALVVLGQMITLFLIVLIGFAAFKRGFIDEKVQKGLSVLLTDIFLPAFLLSGLQIPYSIDHVRSMGDSLLGIVLFLAAGFIPSFLFTKLRRMQWSEAGIVMCCSMFPNCIFLGKPIMNALYAQSADFRIAGFAIFFNIALVTLGRFLVAPDQKEKKSIRASLRYLVNPVTVVGGLGLVLYFLDIQLYAPVTAACQLFANMMTPLSMFLIGCSLAQIHFKGPGAVRAQLLDGRVYFITAIRLFLTPLLTYAIARPLIHDPVTLGVVVIAAAMPVATMSEIYAMQAGNEHAATAAKAVVLSTLLCIASAPAVVGILGLGM